MLEILTGALGGALVSSIAAPYILRGPERRSTRAEVMKAVLRLERVRWAHHGGSTYHDFNAAIIDLKATAMIAGVDSKLVDKYTYLAAVARSASDEDLDRTSDVEYGGGISSSLSDLVRHSAKAVMFALRSPIRARLIRTSTMEEIDALIAKEKKHTTANWSVTTL